MTAVRRRNLLAPALAALVLAAAGLFATWRALPARAEISPSPCAGNVCTGTVVVGAQAVTYSYTEHVSANGELKVRLNGGVYNTSSLISFIVFNVPSFTTWNKYANPVGGAIILPTEDVNPGHTAYERRSNTGCSSCIVDQVMTMKFTGLAAGHYDFNLSIIQNGDSGGKTLRFYVDAGAPSNGDESLVFVSVPGMDYPCSDHIDNDLNYLGDCTDAKCVGKVGDVGSGAKCEQPESTCNDGFDNDGSGKTDCLDPSCDGKIGQPAGTALCQYGNEFGASTCGDNFDNDGDGLTDCVDNLSTDSNVAHTCWKQSAYGCPATEISCTDNIDNDKDKSYDDSWDNAPLTGRDCQDYDCAGNAACPAKENFDAGGIEHDEQCFDGIDNDLDHKIDCGDPDCAGIVNPNNTTQQCYAKEFDLGQRYQFCANGFDDDGDDLVGQPGSSTDCKDTDCKRKFGNCGPCPSREDYTFDSCSDAKDNDADVSVDCADSDCAGKIGTLANAAVCASAGTENTNALCGDGFDNDMSGKADCADPNCAGKVGPQGQSCEPSGESTCADGKDGDGDGLIDCVDPDCAGKSGCAAAWTQAASCQIVPRDTNPTAFTSNSPTVLATVRVSTHVSSTDVVRLVGSGTYSSVTVILGDNTDATKYYPYAAASPTCTLKDTATGLTAARFSFTAVAGHAVQIYNTPGPNISTFDLTFSCPTPATPATIKTYPISLSALKQPGNVAEYGDVNFSTTLYEATAPSVTKVEPEASVGGTVKIPYGGAQIASPETRRVRAVAADAGGPAPASTGICRCQVTINSSTYQTLQDCVATPAAGSAFLLNDGTLTISALTEDGAGNVSAAYNAPSTTLNVTPALSSALVLGPAKPFFRTGTMTATLSATFYTAGNGSFNSTCEVFVRDTSGNIVNGPTGPTTSFVGMPSGNSIVCSANVTLPSMTDGTYYVTIRAKDEDGDTLESNRKVMYMCNTVPNPNAVPPIADSGNGCAYADFDGDGATEGLFTTLYSTTPKACDNCVGLANADQTDANANGVGDVCEPSKQYGRCEIDRDIVCDCDSNQVCDLPCPGPSILPDYSQPGPPYPHKDPQKCIDSWGLCTLDGKVCFNDAECTAGGTAPIGNGYGLCGDSITACKRDIDCVTAGVALPCTGANRCENLLYPWLQTSFGNLFSQKKITAADVPPQNKYNATFCITAKDVILNFKSQLCTATTDSTVKYARPQQGNNYSTVLGKLDIAGLRTGKYGTVINVPSGQLDSTLNSYSNHLGGKVFLVSGDATVSAHTFANDSTNGAGTIFVDGGDLTINGDLLYDSSTVTNLKQLASVGWVVAQASGAKGNIYVNGTVDTIVGAFYAGGTDGFWSVAPPDTDSPTPLTVYGLAVARQFQLSRSYKSTTKGSEAFIYDGRAVANPPPGFGDITKTLPLFTDTLP